MDPSEEQNIEKREDDSPQEMKKDEGVNNIAFCSVMLFAGFLFFLAFIRPLPAYKEFTNQIGGDPINKIAEKIVITPSKESVPTFYLHQLPTVTPDPTLPLAPTMQPSIYTHIEILNPELILFQPSPTPQKHQTSSVSPTLTSIPTMNCSAQNQNSSIDTSYQVHPILFVPKDYPVESGKVAIVDSLVGEVRQFHLEILCKTFYSTPTEIVRGDLTADEYNKVGFYGVLNELSKKGKNPPHTKLIIVMDPHKSIKNAYGGSLGSCGSGKFNYPKGDISNGYVYIVYDTIFDLDQQKRAVDKGARGVIAHELGHAFCLPHPKSCDIENPKPSYCSTTPMYGWWNFTLHDPNYTWLETPSYPERSTLQSSPWMWKSY